MDIAYSVAQVPIRLTDERWQHIVTNHDDLSGYREDILYTVERPDVVLRGHGGTKIAVRNYGHKRYLMVVYRELFQEDGFIITAYFTGKVDQKKAIWRQN